MHFKKIIALLSSAFILSGSLCFPAYASTSDDLMVEINQLENQIADIDSEMARIEKETEDTEQRKESYLSKIDELQTQLSFYESEKEELDNTMEEDSVAMSILSKSLLGTRSIFKTLNERQEQQEESEYLANVIDSCKNNIQAVEKRLSGAEEELTSLSEQSEKNTAQKEELNNTIEQKNNEYSKAREQILSEEEKQKEEERLAEENKELEEQEDSDVYDEEINKETEIDILDDEGEDGEETQTITTTTTTTYYTYTDGTGSSTSQSDSSGITYAGTASTGKYEGYSVSESELRGITALCEQEQGTSAQGVATEASLIANKYQINGKKYGSIYDYVKNSGWWYKASYFLAQSPHSESNVEIVRDIICNGNRTLPTNIDEHDCLSDIKSVSNYGVSFDKYDRSQYIQGVTVIKNNYGSTYTFWCFSHDGGDPFGYTKG